MEKAKLVVLKIDLTDSLLGLPEELDNTKYFGYFLINTSEITHLCEIVGSYYCENLYNQFQLKKDFENYPIEVQELIQNLELRDADTDMYISENTKLDIVKEFEEKTFETDEEKLEYIEEIKEYLIGNPIY